jgi:hypothetical protein
MFVKISRYLTHIFLVISFSAGNVQTAVGQEVFVEFPEELLMVEFDKYLLPRFKFKTQIIVRVSSQSDSLDARLGVIPKGKELFSDLNGFIYRLETITPDASQISKLEKFVSWLNSPSGITTIEEFSINGSNVFKALESTVEKKEEEVFEGDVASGLSLSQQHCKRCHVVDDNAFAGIDSTPSFQAMRSFDDWEERFTAFWTVSPHLNVISINEVYEAGSKTVPVTISPIRISLEQVDDILAYVASINPKDLGKPINFW